MRAMTSGSLIVCGRRTGIPSSSAAWATGVGDDRRERPRPRSGCVMTSPTSWCEAASARSGPTAGAGLPAKATLMLR